MKFLTFLTAAVLTSVPADAQLAQRNQLGLTMGHVHLTVKDVDAQKHFWIDVMGGTLVKNGPLELIQFHIPVESLTFREIVGVGPQTDRPRRRRVKSDEPVLQTSGVERRV